jgi:hypothetical protein
MAVPELLVSDLFAWREWLAANHATSTGVRLVLAKKGTAEPTRLTYDDALLEALCFGWIDGHRTSGDDATYRVRFTPRSTQVLGHGATSGSPSVSPPRAACSRLVSPKSSGRRTTDAGTRHTADPRPSKYPRTFATRWQHLPARRRCGMC